MLAPLGLHDSFTEEGLWWIAGQDNQVAGTLTFDADNGPVLRLLGMLQDVVTSINASLNAGGLERAIIHGVTRNGKLVTLLNASNTRRQLKFPGIATESWGATLLLVGFHLHTEDEEVFPQSYMRFEGIEDWLEHHSFTIESDEAESILTVSANKPKESHFADHADFTLTSVGWLFSSNTPDSQYTIEVISLLGIRSKLPKSLHWHLDTVKKLQELAALCTGQYQPLLSLELRSRNSSGDGNDYASEVQFYAKMIHPETKPRSKFEPPIISGPALMALHPESLQRWFDQYDVLKPAINLFFTVAGEHIAFVNARFIVAIQALEVFHRRTSVETTMPASEFTAFAQALTEAIPSSATTRMREKLKGTYNYLNEPSLGQRLKSIAADLSTSFAAPPPSFGKEYRRKLVDTRNYYTHFSEDLKYKILDDTEMYWASRRIVLIMTLLFLMRIDIPVANLIPFIERHQEFARLWTSSDNPY